MKIKILSFITLIIFVGLSVVGCLRADWFGWAQISKAQKQAYQAEVLRLQALPAAEPLSYYRDVKPIVDRKCIVCHACYDAPCQLKLTSLEGLLRGATKAPVYDASRIDAAPLTRLFVDAHDESAWREKGFFSILEAPLESPGDTSLLNKMLALGKTREISAATKITEQTLILGAKRELACAAPQNFEEYANENPNAGMPLAVAGLSDREYEVLTQWASRLAKGQHPNPETSLTGADTDRIHSDDQKSLLQWEAWLNQKDKKQQLLSRYLFEHLILGHLYFQTDAKLKSRLAQTNHKETASFFKLIRSSTPSGKPPLDVATALANEPPGGDFYYRFVPVVQTLVYKDHIPYRLDDERLDYFKTHFLTAHWQVDSLPGYSYDDRANPFETFAAIPAKLRYEFLLQEAEYFIRNFIRGPVCHGPVATDVIRDQFWVMFEDSSAEQYSNDANYQHQVTPLLGLPGEKDALTELGDQWLSYSRDRNHYAKIRNQHYAKAFPDGAAIDHIWNGDNDNGNAFLTVFRHHDNASVTQGWRGDIPRTAWVMDYPLLERSYYELVVGFNVFGNTSHQLQTRLYFDLIRNGGEVNFLRFLPPSARKKEYDFWYQGAAKLKVFGSYYLPEFNQPSQVSYSSKAPKAELFTKMFGLYPSLTHADAFIGAGFAEDVSLQLSKKRSPPDLLQVFTNKTAEQLPFIRYLPEVTLLSVKAQTAGAQVFSLLRNRMHSNVAFMLGESLRYQEAQDSVTLLPELVGSYPNLMLSVKASDVEIMLKDMIEVETQADFDHFIGRYGVRRMQPQLWTELDGYREHLEQVAPIAAGVMDINRYGYW